jgi:hypothetical protein
LTFRTRAHDPGARYFYYTRPPALCQEKNAKKINKLFFPKVLTNQLAGAIIVSEREIKEIQTMSIRNIADCPFTPDTINGKKVRKIIFKKFAICY